MFLQMMLVSLALFIAPLPAFASESLFEKAIAKGVADMESGDYQAAAAEFRMALAERPEDSDALLYLGIAQSRVSDTDAESTLKKALSLDPSNPRTNLELGILYFNRGVNTEAQDYFENAVHLAPGTPQAANAGEYLTMMATGRGDKRWGVNFLTGLQYDSNVLLNADGAPLPAGIKDRKDWRGIFNLGLNYMPIKTGNFELNTSYSIYQSLHFRLNEFDVNQNQAELTGKYSFNGNLALKAGYTFEYLLVGAESYANSNSGNASLILNGPAGSTTSLEYRYRYSGYKNSDMFLANNIRSGANQQGGVNTRVPVGDSAFLRLGYYFDSENTRREYWNYDGHRGVVAVTARLPFLFVSELSAEACTRRYDAPYPTAGINRKDTSWTASVLLSRFFGDVFSLTAGFYYNRNDSNISDFDYDRTITSLLAQVRF